MWEARGCVTPRLTKDEREEGQRRAKQSPQVAKKEGGRNFQNFSLSLSPQIVGRLEPSWLVLFLFKSRIFKSLPAWFGTHYGKARRVRSAWKRQTTTTFLPSYILSGTNEFLNFFSPTTLPSPLSVKSNRSPPRFIYKCTDGTHPSLSSTATFEKRFFSPLIATQEPPHTPQSFFV